MKSGTTANRAHRPARWMKVDAVIVIALYLLLVTVAWTNNTASPWRLGLAVASWAVVLGVAGLAVRRRLHHQDAG